MQWAYLDAADSAFLTWVCLSGPIHQVITLLGEMADPDYQQIMGLLLHSGGKKGCLEGRRSLGLLLVLLCPVVEVDGKLQQPNPAG